MAKVPYAGGVADVQPDARTPDDYQRIDANPSSFGGAIAQGAEKAGAGAFDLSKFWGHVQADDASNNAQKEASDLAEHIRTLQGQDALDAQKGAYKSLEDIYNKYKNQLATPEQQHVFDGQNRPFFDRYIRGQMNTTFIDAGRQFATRTADATIENAHSMAATSGSDGNWPSVEVSYHKALSGEVKKLQIKGEDRDPEAMAAAKDRAALVYKSGIEGMLLKNPDGAQAKLDDPAIKTALGAAYEPLAKTVQAGVAHSYVSRADAMEADNPVGAEAFVRANEAKFGPLFGEALLKAQRAKTEGGGKALAAGSDAAVGSGWNSPVRTSGDMVYSPKYQTVVWKDTGLPPTEAEVRASTTTPENLAKGAPTRAQAEGGSHSVDDLFHAFHGQESGGGANTTTSTDNAHGDMQIQPATFAAYAKPGERIDARADNIAVGKRILADYSQRYNGDAARVAVAYFSGPGNVAPPGSPTPWISNRHDGQGTYVSQYVNGILTRLGHPGVSAPAPPPLGHGSLTADTSLAAPGWEGATPPTEAPAAAEPGAAATAPAAFTQPLPTPVPPQTPEDVVNAIYEQSARRLRWVDAQGASVEEKMAAKRQIEQEQAYSLAASAAKQAEIKAREDAATEDVLGTARKEGYPAAYQKLNTYMNDPRRPISEKQFETMNGVLERRSGNPNPLAYGARYSEALNNVVKPKSEAQRISDPREIMRMEADGELTEKGADHLIGVLDKMKKSTGEFGLQQRIAGITDYAKEYLDKSVNEPFMTIKDPEGRRKFDVEFLSMLHSELDSWRNSGKNVGDNPLLAPDHKKLDEMLRSIRPRKEISEFQNGALADTPAPGAVSIPPAPGGVNADSWNAVARQVPVSADGKPWPIANWINAIQKLRAAPTPQAIKDFNRYFGAAGYKAEDILSRLEKREAEPNRENQGTAIVSDPVPF